MIIVLSEPLAAQAASAGCGVLVALEAAVGTEAAPTDRAMEWAAFTGHGFPPLESARATLGRPAVVKRFVLAGATRHHIPLARAAKYKLLFLMVMGVDEATSYTGFTYISERTPYTRYGNWFVAVCALLAVMGLVAERMAVSRAGSPAHRHP
jgi:hypothetical protein